MNRRIHRNSPIIRLPLDYSVTLEAARRRRVRRETLMSGLGYVAALAMLVSYLVMFG